jgi:hypothetical protein
VTTVKENKLKGDTIVYCYSLLRLLFGQDEHHLLELTRPVYFKCDYNRPSFSRAAAIILSSKSRITFARRVKEEALDNIQGGDGSFCCRHAACKGSRMTIFKDPGKGCFGERYYTESNDSSRLQALHQRIETAAEKARTAKEQEWQEKTLE